MEMSIETTTGALSAVGLAMIIYGLVEFIYLAFISKKAPFRRHFLQPIKGVLSQAIAVALVQRATAIFTVAAAALVGATLAPLSLPDAWYSLLFALLIYEFWYWVQHYLGHKVRLLWCIHAPHHAPPTMHMLVGANRHFIEGIFYFPLFLGFIPALCGVPVEIIVLINLIDGIWGSLLHISPDVVKRRYGPLEYLLQTPSYHRVHHAKNPRYMDTNYNSVTLFWDWALGTLQPLKDDEPVRYGITRPLQTESYWSVHFGEFRALWRDVAAAPGIWNKLAYLVMPPGWSHTGEHHTVAMQKNAEVL